VPVQEFPRTGFAAEDVRGTQRQGHHSRLPYPPDAAAFNGYGVSQFAAADD
jgi:hypothetical protein